MMKKKSYFESENIIKKGEYYLGECMNKGTFGEVFKALSIKDKKIVAIKKLINADEEEYVNEINILKQMNNCENSIKYLDSFKEKNNKYIVTELCDGSLRNLINERKYGFSIEEIKKIFCQINEGLKYLNSKNLLHRDLKPDNILFNEYKNSDGSINYKYKLCDYGVAKSLEKKLLSSVVGTKLYEAPEIINNEKYSNKSDLFSIGIILYELYYGNSENKLTRKEIINNINKGLKIKNNNNDNINDFNDLKNLIEKCIKNDENRIDWNNYFNHNFFNYEIEIIIEIKEEDLNNNIKIINSELFNENNAELYVNNKKEIFKNEYKFNKIGNHNIKLIFNNNVIKTSLENMFSECKNIKYINFKIFNTSNVENMSEMFDGCCNLKEINLSSFNTSNVENMSRIFAGCLNLKEINLSSFNTSNVKNMSEMFVGCYNLKEINLSSFNTSNVENMNEMFYDCYNLKEINLSSFNTSNVKNMERMFSGLKSITSLDLSNFKTLTVKSMNEMFSYCYSLEYLDLSNFELNYYTDYQNMFSYISQSVKIISKNEILLKEFKESEKYVKQSKVEKVIKFLIDRYNSLTNNRWFY